MFLLLLDNNLKSDTCQDEIKLQKVFCVCSTVQCVSVYSLKAIDPYCAFSTIRSTTQSV